MRILVLGGDGYLGWPTALHLSAAHHHVGIVDNFARRGYDHEMGTQSLVPIQTLKHRTQRWAELSGVQLDWYAGDLTDAEFTSHVVTDFRPDAIVHFAEQRSAPYSMIDRLHAVYTQHNNVVGTLNLLFAIAEADRDIHLVKLGTMGEYGTPNIPIEEGWLEVDHGGRHDRVLYPKRPGSFYHLSKVHDSHNIEFACRAWGLRATDLNQGVVYGQQTEQTAADPRLATRFDYDAVFGTVLNRFVVQAVLGHPLTVYGSGRQTRGVIDIRDTVECIRLACENSAEPGEFRVFNQMTESLSVREIADTVVSCYPGAASVEHIENPRVEADDHFYEVAHTGLARLGLKPHLLGETLIESMFTIAKRHRDRADPRALIPTVQWRSTASSLRLDADDLDTDDRADLAAVDEAAS
ncbi:MAG TPA: NAD-dependent epimerase/dehydratase family protein [Nocardioidaceae bacterium]|nr:NAD-dependent epimerase/dehydratase family protein [Nocardioidaceae bacterium]